MAEYGVEKGYSYLICDPVAGGYAMFALRYCMNTSRVQQVAITAPEEDRVTRLMARDGISEEYARMRISAQKPQDYFREHCDYTLENDRDAAAFSAKCLAFFRQFVIMEETTHKGE